MAHALLKPSLFYLLIFATNVGAEITETSEIINPWDAEIEFGFQRLTGNSDSMAINARLGMDYTDGPYRHISDARFLLIEKDGQEDKRKSELESQANYKFDPKRYILANINYVDDKHGPYFKDLTFSVGIGYQAIWREDLSLLFELGPGYRIQLPNLDELDDKDLIFPHDVREFIFRAQGSIDWQLTDDVFIEGRLTIVSGKSDSRIESRLALINNILDKLALKLSTSQRYLTHVPPGLKNRDSVFTITALYQF